MTPAATLALRLQGIRKTFQNGGMECGVKSLDLEIAPGEGFSLLGPSGCGKTTTLRLIGGFESPDAGRISHGPKDITDLPPQKRDIRTVFQRYALFPHLNAYENIVFSLRMKKVGEAEIKKRAAHVISLIDIAHLAERPISKLSGGEQQRVALARALISEPSVLLLDEPLSALDLKLRERMQIELLALRRKLGSTFIFVTHDQSEAMFLSDRVAVMNKGVLEQIGSPEEIYNRPQTRFVASFIGQANFLPFEMAGRLLGAAPKLPVVRPDESWMIRPENIDPFPTEAALPPTHVGLKVRIKETAFTGQDRFTRVLETGGRELVMRQPSFEPPAGHENQDIVIGWLPEDTWKVADATT